MTSKHQRYLIAILFVIAVMAITVAVAMALGNPSDIQTLRHV